MGLKLCQKAAIFDNDGETIICQALVREIESDSATLIFNEDDVDLLESEMIITFYDEVSGLITYTCLLSGGKKFIGRDRRYKQALKCVLKEQVSVLQRRSDIKVHVEIPIRLLIPPTVPIPEEFAQGDLLRGDNVVVGKAIDLSAGGIFITSLCEIEETSEFKILLPISSDKAIEVGVKILRVVEPLEDSTIEEFGYGCKFINVNNATETAIRNFVFRQQMLHRQAYS